MPDNLQVLLHFSILNEQNISLKLENKILWKISIKYKEKFTRKCLFIVLPVSESF